MSNAPRTSAAFGGAASTVSPSASAIRRTAARQSLDTGCSPSSSNTAIRAGRRGSASAGVASTRSASPRSSAVRAIGPTTPNSRIPGPAGSGACSANGTVPRPGLSPHTPTKWHGLRIEPPRSEPSPSGDIPEPIAAASPPDEPPAVRVTSCGLAVAPNRGLTESHHIANSETLVLPSRIAPAARMRATGAQSASLTWSASSREPFGARMPATASGSLAVNGTPCSGPARRRSQRRVGRHRLGARRLQPRQHQRVDLRVALGDPLRVRLEQLEGRHLRARAPRAPSTSPTLERGHRPQAGLARPGEVVVVARALQRVEQPRRPVLA